MKSSPVIPFIVIEDRQVEKKFKHARDFGIEGNYNLHNLIRFKTAIENHLQSSDTEIKKGKYRGISVFHYFNRQTALYVSIKDNGYFLSGWTLNEKQLKEIIDTGNIGGS